MPFAPSIQSYVGTHAGGTSGFGAAVGLSIDWNTNLLFQTNKYLTRFDITAGVEIADVVLTSIGSLGCPDGAPVQVGLMNMLAIAGTGNFVNPGQSYMLDQTSFAVGESIAYPEPSLGGYQFANGRVGAFQFFTDRGPGNVVIPTLNRINYINGSAGTWLGENDMPGEHQAMCAGPDTTGLVYLIGADTSGTGPLYLNEILFMAGGFSHNNTVGTLAMATVDGTWDSQFAVSGMCLDKTDSKLLVVVHGHPAGGIGANCYLVKLNPADASLIWKRAIPATDGGSPVVAGNTFSQSDIRHQRIGFYTGSPATATIINTSDGSVVTSYNAGLAGLFPRAGGQGYSDTLGGIFLSTDFADGAGAPTRLNATPANFSDCYAMLYVAAAIPNPPPTVETDVWFAFMGPARPRA